ncbi:rCG44051, isoform CRA_a [Rattus norvegicus]|uniref:RCG44051, isoform CRA_a n=1 Tax=Rattus norvegicus TaxID=10116 RepID=A6J7N9_RAT|nr:rCG44051, isoform CRA_a [Rattus norvegicus]
MYDSHSRRRSQIPLLKFWDCAWDLALMRSLVIHSLVYPHCMLPLPAPPLP